MIFAMSDVHAHYDVMEQRIQQIRPYLDKGDSKLILLGDYIDRGDASYECLKAVYDLQKEYGKNKVIALKGNHEVWFIDFLSRVGDEWLAEDDNYKTSITFLDKEQKEKLRSMSSRNDILRYIVKCIKTNHRELLVWLKKLPEYYETSTQIFVHAGVDEDIPEEEMDYCLMGTPEYMLTGKYPPTTGYFYKDVIAGHVAASSVANDINFKGIYFDGESHFYIDGATTKTKRILCLAYDEAEKQYYEFLEDDTFKKIRRSNLRKNKMNEL